MEDRIMNRFGTFAKDTRGTVAYIAAIMMLPMAAFTGLGLDYSRSRDVKSQLQGALDSTVLMLSREAPKKSEAQLQALADPYFKAVIAHQVPVPISGIKVTKTDTNVTVRTSATVKTFFGPVYAFAERLFGGGAANFDTWTIDIATTAAYGTRKIELAMVLDNTGSMASSNKIGELKKASRTLLDILKDTAIQPDQIKVALVPYTTRVNLGTTFKNEDWLTPNPTGKFEKNDANYAKVANRNAWDGCVVDRDTGYNATIKPFQIGIDESKYPMIKCADGLARAMPLTSDWNALNKRIDEMNASGWTNITLGAQWGYEMLSGAAPFTEASGSKNVERFMILLTDGNNTVDRWTKKGQEGSGSNETRMNTDTKAMCDAITERNVAAKTLNITLYTVLVINGNEDLLKSCASSPDKFLKVKQASELEAVFKKIANEIGGIRLTM
jgi:Flp pilus assembly protein TadG